MSRRDLSSGAGKLPSLLALFAASCGSDPVPVIAPRWKYEASAEAAAPGIGPERRVVVALASGQGEVVTLNEENGTRVEGPIAAFPTLHAPATTGTTIVIVSSIGKLVGYSFAGEQRFSVPDVPLGITGPLGIAGDGSIRIATTSGRLVGFDAMGGPKLDVAIGGAASGALGISAGGTTYVATDSGRVAGVDGAGAIVFDTNVNAPASGPSTDGSKVAAGELDGVRAFDGNASELWKRPRAARVTGTRFTRAGEVMAWGEDGIFELLDAAGGTVIATFATASAAPIYAPVIEVKTGNFAVIDNNGIAYLVDRTGKELDRYELGGTPKPELAVGELGFVFVTVGSTVRSLDFAFQ